MIGLLIPIMAVLGPSTGDNGPSQALLRQIVAKTAVAQLESIDPLWHPEQRDCAGLIRFAYRAAYKTLAPERVEQGLWRDNRGNRAAFADAETLIASNFASIGRGDQALSRLDSGDLVAFRQIASEARGPVYHLMLVVRPVDRAHNEAHVVYHPGIRDAAVRVGSLRSLMRDAPREWQPVSANPFFLGFYRLREWTHD